MSVDLRLPNINATTNEGKIEQLQSFVYQLVQELNFCLNLLEKKTNDVSSEVFDSKGNSKIEVNTNNILLKVEQGDSISDINLSPEGIKIDASKIDLNGYTTINGNFSVDENGDLHLKGENYVINSSRETSRNGALEITTIPQTNNNGIEYISDKMFFTPMGIGYRNYEMGDARLIVALTPQGSPIRIVVGDWGSMLELVADDEGYVYIAKRNSADSEKIATQEWVTDNFQAKT